LVNFVNSFLIVVFGWVKDSPTTSTNVGCMGTVRGGIDNVGNKIESFMPMNVIQSIGGKLFRKQNISELLASRERENVSLPKILTAFDLTAIGIGCIIGAGIFVVRNSNNLRSSIE